MMGSLLQIQKCSYSGNTERYKFRLFTDSSNMENIRSKSWQEEQERPNAYWKAIFVDQEVSDE